MLDVLEQIGTTAGQTFDSLMESIGSLFTDERQAHLLNGKGRAYRLDWSNEHSQVTPADPAGGATLTSGYGSLNRIFYAHLTAQLAGNPKPTAAELFRARQYALVETLNVTESPRYEPGGDTYCNIYAYDFIGGMGGYLPRVWWSPAAWKAIEGGAEIIDADEWKSLKKAGGSVKDKVAPVYADTLFEQNANALNQWFRTIGPEFGWREENDMTAAQDAANEGKLAVLCAANKVAKNSGHISVILAESTDHQAKRDTAGNVTVPLQSQAGRTNFKYDTGGQWWANKDHKNGAAWILER